MKMLVNGTEAELQPTATPVTSLADRLLVHGEDGTHSAVSVRVGDVVHVSYRGRQYVVERPGRLGRKGGGAHSGELRAPMPGLIVDILVAPGQEVTQGTKLAVLEAMKTQQPFLAPFDGTVVEIKALKGEQVTDGQLILRIEPLPEK